MLKAQTDCKNLLPNPSFEDYLELPVFYGEWFKVASWNNLEQTWPPFDQNYGSPDFLHTDATFAGVSLPDTDFGDIAPHTGKAVFHFATWSENTPSFREYVSAKLIENLIPGTEYEVSFWISNGSMNLGGNGSNGLGVCFTEVPLVQQLKGPITNANPQWMTPTVIYEPDWRQISFTLLADKPYQYFTIGGFLTDAEHTLIQFEPPSGGFGEAANYFIDDLSVKKTMSSIAITTDSEPGFCPGDSIELKINGVGQSLLWSTGASSPSIFVNQPGLYTLMSSGDCGVFTDTLEVKLLDCKMPFQIPNAFTPNGDGSNDLFGMVPDGDYLVEKLLVYNRWGSKVFESIPGKTYWDGTFSGVPAPSDVYIYRIEIRDIDLNTVEQRSGEFSLLR